MMNLHTRPHAFDSHVIVAWATGLQKNGFLKMDIGSAVEDRSVLAELRAIEYLMLERKIFNVDPVSGKSFALHVSTGAIKKLALKKSKKTHLYDAATFLSTRLEGINVHVTKNDSLIPELDETAADRAEVVPASRGRLSSSVFESPILGTVEVTAHALRRFVQHHTSGSMNTPWRSLVGRLSHPGLRQYPLPDRHQRHKLRKYGTIEGVEVWAHPTSSLAFLFINHGAFRRLLTVFKRQPIGS